ncbi:MAG: 50S ribosomal protein L4 [Candidatus Bathyarchaeota archaeon]|nr:50S ribosomal protein L4 [Candidatus Bathyarchaeota archaeon]
MSNKSTRVFDLDGEEATTINIPKIFNTPHRPDVIKRAVVTIQSHRFQPQGRDPMAGKRTTAESRGAGLGIARVPRMKERGQRAAFAPGTVGGRSAHPPVAEKRIKKRIPKKEMRLALCSAIAATGSKEIVDSRGHMVDDVPDFPLVVVNEIQNLKRTKDVEDAFIKLGVWPDILRVKQSRKVRAGKGKMRGRKMKQAIGPLLVITKNEGIAEAARNLPGIDVASVENLNAELLAPGTHPGRLTIWTSSALEKLEKVFGGK